MASAVAVVGFGCRFPGAPSPEAFWRLLRDGVDAISEVPLTRWDAAALHDPTLSRPGSTNTRWGGFLDGIEQFEPGFFGMSRGEAAAIDPEQRLLLEVAWEALEHGGFAAGRLAGSDTGVYLGIGPSDYAATCFGDLTRVNAYVASGTAPCMAANRVSHWLDLHGPSLGVDTGCSSSLVAVHLACAALRSGAIGMALAGAVNLMLSPRTTVGLSQAWMTAADGRCKPFDAAANGYVRGEGCGMVVLKRLADALRDGDTVFGVLRGTAVNQDGRGNGLTVPNRSALEAVLRRAMTDAGIRSGAIDYVEAHGVGSALTDAVEAQALSAVFDGDAVRSAAAVGGGNTRPVLGAVKGNIGHLEPAAGIAGLIKVLLALGHEEIPPNLHFHELNPRIGADTFSFRIAKHRLPWPRGTRPRIAGVNAFGLGGTNAHVIVEEGPADSRRSAAALAPANPVPYAYTLSARTPSALRELSALHARHLEAHPGIALADAAYTVNVGRATFAHRLVARASASPQLIAQLDAFARDETSDGLSVDDGSRQGNGDDMLRSLADRWVRGEAIDWSTVHAEPRRRVALPTYAFQRRRCWADGPATAAIGSAAVAPIDLPGGAGRVRLQPDQRCTAAPVLRTASGSVLGALVRSPLGSLHVAACLAADAPACLGDHRILGEAVVSGPTQAAMTIEMWMQVMGHRSAVLSDIVFPQPLVLAPAGAHDVQVVMTSAGEQEAAFEIFSRPVDAANAAAEWLGHGRGRILEDDEGRAPSRIELAAIERRCSTVVTADAFYDQMAARAVQLGPSFRWLEEIRIGDGEAIARLRDPGPQDAGANAFRFHPGRFDTFFQVLFAAQPPGNAERDAAMLLAVNRWQIGESDAQPRHVHARLRPGDGANTLVGDVTVLDDTGLAVMEIAGLHFVRASRDALLRGAAPAARRIPSATAQPGLLARELALLPATERRAALHRQVEVEVARLLGSDASTPLDRGRGFFDLGLDSLSCIALLNQLRTAIGPAHALPSTVVFDYPSIDALAEHLLRTLHPDTPVAAAVRRPSVAVAANEAIAIVGIGCRFPGGADGPDQLWQLLRDGVDAIVDVPRSRWDAAALYHPDPQARGKTSTRRGGFLDDVSGFDARFFGIAPREVESLDPQQRLLLEVAWEALEHAGIAPGRLKGSRSAVFVGTCFDDYARFRLNAGDLSAIDAYTGTGVEACFSAGRLAYLLGLHGPAVHVDTACSTSLVALHLACQSLRTGESDLALAGAANLILTPENTVAFSRLGAMAADGRCKAFDAAADGYGRGEGCGVLVLKRLSTALADGDRVLALVRGSAVNHDGASSGLTVPNGLAQQAVIRQALENAGVAPHDVSYVEAHGTGTPLGDPIEIGALGAVLGAGRAPGERFLVGSIKTNIGHLEPAAGVAGVIKVVLSMLHGEIPAHLHFQSPNPHLSLEKAHAAVPTRLTPWRPSGPRIAGVSSFGMSGTNAHVVLEEAPGLPAAQTGSVTASGTDQAACLLTLSAHSASALETMAGRFVAHLGHHPEQSLADVCATAFSGRSHFAHRLAVTASSTAELHHRLTSGEGRRGRIEIESPPRVAFLFTGQGIHWSGMGRQLFDRHPLFRNVLERCDARLAGRLPRPLLSLLLDADAAPLLERTDCAQPALYALQAALAALWRSAGVEPAMVLGHSVGELAAAHVAGLIELEDGLALTAERGRLMQSLSRPGAMVAVLAPESRVRELLRTRSGALSVAAVNGPMETVVSGDREAVLALTADLMANGERPRPLHVSHAFHSTLMEPILDELEERAAAVAATPGRIPLVSSRSGAPVTTLHAGDWRAHARQPVRFADGLETLNRAGCRIFIEIGPGTTLTALGRKVLGEDGGTFLPSLRKGRDDGRQLLDTAGSLYTLGVPMDLLALDASVTRARVALPTYPFERTRYWLATPPAERRGQRAQPARRPGSTPSSHPLLGDRIDTALPSLIFESQLTSGNPSFLADHRLHGVAVLPATAYFDMALLAAATLGGGAAAIERIAIHRALLLDDHEPRTVQVIVTPTTPGEATFEIASRERHDAIGSGAGSWTSHVAGNLRLDVGRAPVVVPLDVAAVCSRLAMETDMAAFYERLRAHGLEYGAAFRGIDALWRRPGEAFGQVALPGVLRAGADQFRAHPALLDAALQVLVAAIPDAVGQDGRAERGPTWAYAPVGAERVRCDEALPERIYSHAVLRPTADNPGGLIGDVHIHDREGRPVATIEGLRVRRIASDALQRMAVPTESAMPGSSQASRGDELFYEIRWRPVAAASPLSPAAADDGHWIVFADGSALADAVSARLRRRGRCARVHAGDRYDTAGSGEWIVDPAQPDHFERLLRDAAAADGPVRGIVWLWGLGAGERLAPASLRQLEQQGLRGLLHLSQALVRGTQRPRLAVITRAAVAIDRAASALDPAQAALIGFAHALELEHPDLPGVAIDLDPSRPLDEADALVAALRSDGERRIALRAGGHWVPRLVTARVAAGSTTLRADATYLITGGLGGLGMGVARWMAERGAGHVVLVGRGAATTATETLASLARGTSARIIARTADVSQRDSLAGVIDGIRDHLPPLRGIVHAAGVLDDGMLLNQSWERCERVLAPKVRGAVHLHQLSRELPLDFFVMFSSIASLLGSRGQASYLAANAVLDALAHARRAEGLPALSINWGPWAEVGMADRTAHAAATRRGIGELSPVLALDLFGRLLAPAADVAAQVGIVSVGWTDYLTRFPDGAVPPLFAEVAHATTSGHATQAPRGELTRQLAAIREDDRREALVAHVRGVVAQALGLADWHALDQGERLFALGLDSLMAVEVSQRLKTDTDHELPATLLFDYTTVNALADYLATHVYRLPAPPARMAGHASPALAGDDDLARTAASIEHLSDDAIEAMLLARLDRTVGGL